MTDTDFAQKRRAVIEDIIRLTREKYVFPEAGEKIASQIQNKLDEGE
jgi:hypothetical protein